MSPLERVLNIYITTLWKEGERYAQIKLLTLGLETLETIRRVILSYFLALIACIFFAGSLFSMLFYNLSNYSRTGHFVWDTFNVVNLIVSLVSLGFLIRGLKESAWMKIFGIEKKIQELAELKSH